MLQHSHQYIIKLHRIHVYFLPSSLLEFCAASFAHYACGAFTASTRAPIACVCPSRAHPRNTSRLQQARVLRISSQSPLVSKGFLKILWCCVGEGVKHENLVSSTFRAVTLCKTASGEKQRGMFRKTLGMALYCSISETGMKAEYFRDRKL